MKKKNQQVNTLTNEAMQEIIQALQTHPEITPYLERAEREPRKVGEPPQAIEEKPKYRSNFKVWTLGNSKLFSIAYSDNSFSSINTRRIELPYHGTLRTLPGHILTPIYESAIETCYTIREFKEMQEYSNWAAKHAASQLDMYLRVI